MYKSLALAALLVPFSGYSAEKDVRINELKEAQYQKALELQQIAVRMRKIAAQCYDYQEYDNFLRVSVQQTNKSEEELKKYNTELENKLAHSLFDNKDFNVDLSKELFYKSLYFDAFKGLFIESAIEKYLLALMAEELKRCLDELLLIKKELKSLL
ncbi:hypothetical protein JST99_03270 [Candidatus Dependentiae bacterium]|nr:hypothetical protein [Candidatus Dependentiae bacterium]